MEIRRIKHGEVITEPGFYEMPIEWHHSQCCDGFSVSSSGLRLIDLNSPLHFWDEYVNPAREEDDDEDKAKEKKHFRMGRAGHTLMLEPEKFERGFCVRPAMFDSWRTKAAKEWRLERIKEGYTVLSADEMQAIHGIAIALKNHRWHADGILGGVIETSMIVRDPKTGIWLKGRPDAIPLHRVLVDLKVQRSAKPSDVAHAIRSLGYDMQMALGGICWSLLTGEPIDQNWLLAIEAQRPHAIHIATLSADSIHWARLRLRRALDTLSTCLAQDYWPAYGLDGQEVGPDSWQTERYGKLQSSGLLPAEDGFAP